MIISPLIERLTVIGEEAERLKKYAETLAAQDAKRRREVTTEFYEIEQILGKVLGFPWYKDDPVNSMGYTEADGVCVGPNTPVTLAQMAAEEIACLRHALEGLMYFAERSLYSFNGDIGRQERWEEVMTAAYAALGREA